LNVLDDFTRRLRAGEIVDAEALELDRIKQQRTRELFIGSTVAAFLIPLGTAAVVWVLALVDSTSVDPVGVLAIVVAAMVAVPSALLAASRGRYRLALAQLAGLAGIVMFVALVVARA